MYDHVINDLETLQQLRKEGELLEKEITSIAINRLYMKPGTQRIPLTVAENGIRGRLFVPPGDGPFPGNFLVAGGNSYLHSGFVSACRPELFILDSLFRNR